MMNARRAGAPAVRVLIVDDHAAVRDGLELVLNAAPRLACIAQVDSATAAIRAIEALSPDVVLLDLDLAQGSGMDVLTVLSERHPHVAALVLSMHDDSIFAAFALRAGAAGYLTKAATPDAIVDAVRQVASGRRPYVSGGMRAAADGARRRSPDILTPRELEVVRGLARGESAQAIATALGVSAKTVDSHARTLCERLGLENSLQLRRWATIHYGGAAAVGANDEAESAPGHANTDPRG